jgi:hypothetical protein
VHPVVSSILDGDGISSVGSRSDRSGSPVEDPPLLDVFWEVVSDSQSVLMTADMLVVEQGSVGLHDRFDLELDSVSKWVSWEFDSLLIDVPLLVETIVTWEEDDVSSMSVGGTMDINADAGMVDKSSSSEGDLLVWLVSPLSAHNNL